MKQNAGDVHTQANLINKLIRNKYKTYPMRPRFIWVEENVPHK